MPKTLSFPQIENLSPAETRKEYTRLRDIFQKRVKRLAEAGYTQKAAPYQPGGYYFFPKQKDLMNRAGVKPLTEAQRTGMLKTLIKDLTNLIGPSAKESPVSIKGIREKKRRENAAVLTSLQSAGYDRISQSTLKNFGRFMDEMRKMYGKKNPNSEEQAEFFNSLKYRTKRKETRTIVDLWREYERNGFKPDYGSQDLFAT